MAMARYRLRGKWRGFEDLEPGGEYDLLDETHRFQRTFSSQTDEEAKVEVSSIKRSFAWAGKLRLSRLDENGVETAVEL